MIETTTMTATILATVLAGVAVAYIGIQIYQKKKRDTVPWKWEEVGTLNQLFFYPLKSGHRIELTRGDCTEYGMRQCKEDEKLMQLRDRCLLVYAERDHELRTSRNYPKMFLIKVAVHDESHLAINAPTMETLYVKVPEKAKDKEVTVAYYSAYHENVQGLDCGDDAALWFSRYILQKDSGVRLSFNAGDVGKHRQGKQHSKAFYEYYKNYSSLSTGIYSDEVSIHMVTQPSVKDLQQRISTDNITVNNFRANIVVDGPGLKPYDEDDWEWMKIGGVILRTTNDCTRCTVPTIDPDSGVRNSTGEPTKTLKKYRVKGPFAQPVMGLNLEVRKTGPLKVGEKIFVARRK